MIEKVNIGDKFKLVNEYWSPRIAGQLNEAYIKFAKLKGEFVWHHHENEDELFLVVKGALRMALREREITIEEGEFIIIPSGVEHKPIADSEVHVLLIEPKGTINTGNIQNDRTRAERWI